MRVDMRKVLRRLGGTIVKVSRPLAKVGEPLKDAGAGWLEHNVSRMAAAIAYYGIFGLAPMLVIMVLLAGVWFGKDATEGLIVDRLSDTLGADSARFVQSMLAGAYESRGETLATVLAILLLMWTATRIIGATRGALNDIWGVGSRGGGRFLGYVLGRLVDLGMVIGIGFMFLASMLANAAVSALTGYFSNALPVPNWALQGMGGGLLAGGGHVLLDDHLPGPSQHQGALVTHSCGCILDGGPIHPGKLPDRPLSGPNQPGIYLRRRRLPGRDHDLDVLLRPDRPLRGRGNPRLCAPGQETREAARREGLNPGDLIPQS